jgi:hypothetical protein
VHRAKFDFGDEDGKGKVRAVVATAATGRRRLKT